MGMVMTMKEMKLMIEKFYIGEVPGVANNDTTYLDGAKTPTEMGFISKTRWSLMIWL